MNSKETKKRRSITAVRRWKIVDESATKLALHGTATVDEFLTALKEEALQEVASKS